MSALSDRPRRPRVLRGGPGLLATALLALVAPLAAGSAPWAVADDSAQVLERLGELADPSASVRRAAQRWLAVHLDAERDFAALGAAVADGDLEVRRGLAGALAMQDENLALAVQAAASSAPALAEVGADAIAEMLGRWSPGMGRSGLAAAGVVEQLDLIEGRVSLDVQDVELGVLLDRMSRSFGALPPLVLDPELDAEVRRLPTDLAPSAGTRRGTFPELAYGVAKLFSVKLEGFGFVPNGRRWIRFCKDGDEGERTGAELVAGWCVAVARAEPGSADASARALAATGWPAGIAWLERRAARRGVPGLAEGPELAGLLLAAGRGHVVPELVRPRTQRALYARADRAAERGGAGLAVADAVLHALMAGGPLGPDGEDLTRLALEGWRELRPRARWLRLAVLEAQRAAGKEALARVRETIEDDASGEPAAALRFQALRTLRAMPVRPESGTPLELGDPAATWRFARRYATLDELVELVLDLGLALPVGWSAPGASPVDDSAEGREAVLEVALFQALRSGRLDDRERLAGRFASLARLADEIEARAAIARWSRRGADGLLAGLLEELRAGATGDAEERLERLALATGRVPDARRKRLYERAAVAPATDRETLFTLAALSAGEYGREARAVLRWRLGLEAGTAEDRATAVALACATLREARDVVALRAFELGLRRDLGLQPGTLGSPEPPPLERGERSLALTGP